MRGSATAPLEGHPDRFLLPGLRMKQLIVFVLLVALSASGCTTAAARRAAGSGIGLGLLGAGMGGAIGGEVARANYHPAPCSAWCFESLGKSLTILSGLTLGALVGLVVGAGSGVGIGVAMSDGDQASAAEPLPLTPVPSARPVIDPRAPIRRVARPAPEPRLLPLGASCTTDVQCLSLHCRNEVCAL